MARPFTLQQVRAELATTLGRVLYVLMAICILLLVWQFTHKSEKDVPPNGRLLSDAYGSALRVSFSAAKRERWASCSARRRFSSSTDEKANVFG